MSALPQPKLPVESYPRRSSFSNRKTATYNRQARISNRRPAGFIKRELPVKLQLLMLFQKASFGLALVSMASSMSLYLATVRIPEFWSREYKNLETLQRQERQLTEINETLKYQMARQAETEASQLSSLQPEEAVFVSPAEITLEAPKDFERDRREKIAFKYTTPGY